jgi:hypothetical protein
MMEPEPLSAVWYRNLTHGELLQLADPLYPNNRIYDAAVAELRWRKIAVTTASIALLTLAAGAILAAIFL